MGLGWSRSMVAKWLLARGGEACCVNLVHSTWQSGLSRCLSSIAVSGNAAVEEWRGLRIHWYGEDICDLVMQESAIQKHCLKALW